MADLVPVVACKACGHVVEVKGLPADDEGRPFASFRHKCPKCGSVHQTHISDIRKATKHRKQ